MAVDPSIALSFKPIQLANPLAQYGQIAAIQDAQTRNQLNQLQMREAEATAQERNQLRQLDPTDPNYVNHLFRLNPQLGIQYRKEASAAEASKAATASSKASAAKSEFELAQSKAKDSIRQIAQYNTIEDAMAHIQDELTSGKITPQQAQQFQNSLPQSNAQMRDWQVQMLRRGLDAEKQLEQQYTSQDLGNRTRLIATNKYGGGNASVVAGSEINKAMSPDASARLAFDQSKFAWEKANPGFELKETEDGSIVGVNKRTLQAFPVTTGGAIASPSGAPTVGGIPTGRTAPSGQLIPTSAPVEGAPVMGTPLKGKSTALTESQNNATAFGMRMKESDAILEDLAKKGTLRGANIQATPLVGEALGKVLPSFLGGTNEAQQMVNQAKTNFITAVLRKESGAAIGQNEFDTEDKKYFPQLGDSAGVLKQKADARKLAIRTMEIQAGPGAKNIREYVPTVNANQSGGWEVVR